MDSVVTNTKGKHRYPGDRAVGDCVEGGESGDIHPYENNGTIPQCLASVSLRERDRTAVIELKLSQGFTCVYQYPFYLIFLYLMKAYDNLDLGQQLQVLVGYKTGLKLRGLLVELWLCQEVVTSQNGFHGPQL